MTETRFSNSESEGYLLTGLMLDPIKFDALRSRIDPGLFFSDRHRQLFVFLVRMRQQGLDTGDIVAINGAVKQSLGESFVSDMALEYIEYYGIAGRTNLDHVLTSLRDLWSLRRLHETQKRLEADLNGEGSAGDILASLRRSLDSISSEISSEMIDMADIDHENDSRGILTGIAPLDKIAGGPGLVCGQVTLVEAYHKGGKTSLGLQLGRALFDRGNKVLYGTFADLGPAKLKSRVIKQISGLGAAPKAKFDLEEGYHAAVESLREEKGRWMVYHAKRQGRDIDSFCASARAWAVKAGPHVVIADYVQKIRGKPGTKSKVEEMEYVSDQLSELAEDLDTVVIALSQVTKGEKGERTSKYARAFEEDAGLVLSIIRDTDDPMGNATIEIPYNRHGPSGSIKGYWNEQYVRFDISGVGQ